MLALNDSYGEYLKSLRAVARGVWTGAMTYDQAIDALDLAIRAGITRAWYEGLAEAGIQPVEMSDEEQFALRQMVVYELTHISGLIDYAEKNNKVNGGAWGMVDAKVALWALRAKDARNRALTMAKSDPKLVWRLGRTERHCGTCSKLDGKVKRSSYWRKIGVQPQNPPNPYLECQGWHCDCGLFPTEEPMSKGTLGNLP